MLLIRAVTAHTGFPISVFSISHLPNTKSQTCFDFGEMGNGNLVCLHLWSFCRLKPSGANFVVCDQSVDSPKHKSNSDTHFDKSSIFSDNA